MIQIPLEAIPNQSFTITINNVIYNFVIKETNGVMSCSITKNNVLLVENSRMASGMLLLPYEYMEQGDGNFFMLTYNDDYAYYTQFGVTQTLVYLTQEDLDNAALPIETTVSFRSVRR